MRTQTAETRLVRCRRCGYDQRGIIAQWTDGCPLEGVCAECGLRFDWASVFDPRRHRPDWCVEFGWRALFPVRIATTLFVTCLPWYFWRSLQMHHEPQWRPLGAYLATLVLCVPAVLLGEIGWEAYRSWRVYNNEMIRLHGWVATLPPAQLQHLAATQGASLEEYEPVKSVSMLRAVGHAVIAPLSTSPSGFTQDPNGFVIPYHTPESITLSRFRNLRECLHNGAVPRTAAFPFIVALLLPIAFALLPRSRRIAAVRREHLVRVTIYSLAFPLLALAWWIHTFPNAAPHSYTPRHEARRHWGDIALPALLLVPAALVIWWGFAISRHLQMRKPWLVAALLGAIAYLLPMALGYFWLIAEQRPEWFMSD